MEITTLQQRIEERAKKRLEQALLEASGTLITIGALIGREEEFKKILAVREHYPYGGGPREIRFDSGQDIYDKLLPKYVANVTDEILHRLDEVEYLLKNPHETLDLP